MIEAICDGCKRKAELKLYSAGFAIPEGWKTAPYFSPIDESIPYKIYCSKCRKDLLTKVDE